MLAYSLLKTYIVITDRIAYSAIIEYDKVNLPFFELFLNNRNQLAEYPINIRLLTSNIIYLRFDIISILLKFTDIVNQCKKYNVSYSIVV